MVALFNWLALLGKRYGISGNFHYVPVNKHRVANMQKLMHSCLSLKIFKRSKRGIRLILIHH